MAADAELRLGDLVVRDHALVDLVATLLFACGDRVGVFLLDDIIDDALLAAAVDRFEDLARLDAALAVDLAVLLLDPVAGNARYALAGNLAAQP